MAKKGSFSKVYDKNGDYVDVEAARFDGTRTFQMQGDVSATQTWNGDSASALTLNTSIGSKKVTTDKINDKAVQTGQIDDGAVGLTQIATNAMNGTVQDNDSKLATHAAVKTYVDAQISGQGTYLGKKTVAEVNAMVTANLHNGDRVQMADAGTINLGPGGVGFDVVAGEDLILYKSGSTVQWDTMDGDFKTKQTAVVDPTASGTTITAIDTISQNANGEITATKKTIRTGNGSNTGVVKLSDSTSSTSGVSGGVAATPAAVKAAYDLASTANTGLANKQDKPSSATENNIAVFNGSKSTKDSGKAFLPSTSTWDGTSDDKVPTAKAVQALLDDKADFNKVVAIADATYTRENETGPGWNKLASIENFGTWRNNIGTFDLYFANLGSTTSKATLLVNVRWDGTRTNANIVDGKIVWESKNGDFNVAIVNRASSSSVITEIWAYLPKGNYSMALSYRSGSTKTASSAAHSATFTDNKDHWSFFSYLATSQEKPAEDLANYIKVKDADVIILQKNVPSATSGNFAGLDANGLLTDSGKKAADFATAAQGTKADSAVQDVTVDGASVVNASTKVAAVPNASTSAKGAVQLAGSIGATVASENNKAATEKAVRDAINALDAEVTSNDGTNVQVKVTEADGKISAVNVTTDNTENKNNKVTSVRDESSATDTAYPSEKAVRDALDSVYTKVYPWVRTVDVTSTTKEYKVCDITNLPTGNYNGFRFKFDFFREFNSGNFCSSTGYVEVRIKGNGVSNEPYYYMDTVLNAGMKISDLVPVLKLYKNYQDDKVSLVLTVTAGGSSSNGFVSRINGCIRQNSEDLVPYVTMATNTVYSVETGYTEVVFASGRKKDFRLAYNEGTAVGSSSVPTYVDASGLVTACTDDFVHDADLASYELLANKVSAWQTTPDDTHYPSEKLVKDELDAKADLNKVVAIADVTVARTGQSGNGWYKIGERTFMSANQNVNSIFDVYASQDDAKFIGSLTFCIRSGSSSGSAVYVRNKKLFSDNWSSYCNFKIVVRGLTGSATVELWASCTRTYGGLSIAERNTSSYTSGNTKGGWTFTSYINNGGADAPVADATNNVSVDDVDVVIRQHAIASPTDNNLVAMDANGRIKDSGLTKASVESAISSAGSAIQGVKVNSTTLTPDANKVVTVPLATTSADGAMSAADKTKLDGIAEGAEANVQADWDETSSSADSFIKNKPYYYKYNGSSVKYYKICVTDKLSSSTGSTYTIDFAGRFGDQSAYGRIIYRNICSLYMFSNKITSESSSNFPKFYYAENQYGRMDFYYKCPAYVSLTFSTTLHYTKTSVDFTNFGTEVESLPEGATEITPVWVANASASSGTAPVKVDAYGALTPVPMDSTPTASSTNLMTSGDIKTALDNIVAEGNKRYPFGVRNNRNTSYGYKLFNVKFSTAQSATRVRVSGNLFVGTTGDTEHILFNLVVANVNVVESNPSAIVLNTTSTRRGSRVVRLAFKRPSDWSNGLDVYLLWSADGTATVSNDTYGWELTLQEGVSSDGLTVKDENLTSALTGFELDTPRTTAITEGTSAIGSSSVPVYVTENGVATACTVDSAPTASSANLVTSGGIKTALDGKQNTLPTSGTASDTYAINISGRASSATLWAGNISGVATSANTKRFVYIGRKKKTDYGCLIGLLTVCSHTDSKDTYVVGSGWTNSNFGNDATIQRISSGGYSNPVKICLYNHEIIENGVTYSELWVYIPTSSGEADFYFRQLFNYSSKITLAQSVINQAESSFSGTLTKCGNSDSRSIAYAPSNTSVGSDSIPVYVNQSGAVTPCTDDFVHDGDVAQTYSSTSEAPISGKGVADALVSTGSGYVQVRGTASNMATVFKFSVSSSYTTNGIAEVWSSSGAHYHLQFSVGANAETVSFEGTYAERSNFVNVAYKYDSTAKELTVAVNLLQYYTTISKKVVSIKANSGTVDVAYEYVNGAIDNTYTTYNCARRAFIRNDNSTVGSTSVPAYVMATGQLAACTDDFVHDGDVTSTYSATGTAPVNGTAVASAISTKQDTLSFMTAAEAQLLWQNAKNNAS